MIDDRWQRVCFAPICFLLLYWGCKYQKSSTFNIKKATIYGSLYIYIKHTLSYAVAIVFFAVSGFTKTVSAFPKGLFLAKSINIGAATKMEE